LVLGEDIPLRDSLDLTLAEHVDGFIALNGPLGCGELPKPQPRIHAAFDKAELARFARGLQDDLSAVTAELTLSWSNGVTEGHVHRLKLVKRQGYGRAGFALSRQRVLQVA
jgi:hypothetical protein